ncbi:MAG TPA: hypothetical protein PLU22_15795 [Polyangiaceae bacterium]|nr:hypothetical protein [Polyangiaceae bacterium]
MRETSRSGLLAALLIAAAACKGSPPTAGGECPVEGSHACESPTTHLACHGGRWRAYPCRGPKGCTVNADVVECDATLAAADTPCDREGHRACSADGKSELDCARAAWRVASACLGPRGCSVVDLGNAYTVECDASVARAGAPCRSGSSRACSEDGRRELECRDGTYRERAECAKGCTASREGKRITIRCE